MRWYGCNQFRSGGLSRRACLQIGGLAGLSLPLLLQNRAEGGSGDRSFGRAKSLIVLYLHGGHAQQETWDPKPGATGDVKGEFGAISSAVGGVQVSELLPRCARLMDKLGVVRSLSHSNPNHVQACLPAMTGHSHDDSVRGRGDFPPSASDFPPFGAVLDRVSPARQLPTWIQIGPRMRRNNGTVLHGQVPGLLGARHAPLVIDQDLTPNAVQIQAVALEPDITVSRLHSRARLLETVDQQRRALDRLPKVHSVGEYQQRALSLLTSSSTAAAFQLAQESTQVRDRYGRNQFGQCCLLARRLAEAGVPVINVHFCESPKGSWDTHSRHFEQMRKLLCPTFDQAFSALVEDLSERGLHEQTLIAPLAEFGRTPKVNRSGGRDHWPWVYSLAFSGGGINGGVVYGASDAAAAYPQMHPREPKDVAATIYHLLGLPPDTLIRDATGRPHRVIIGKPISEILA